MNLFIVKKNTFLTHLNSLTSAEVKKFGIYLRATYGNSKVLLKIYEFYVKFHCKKKPPPDWPVAYESIFTKKHRTKTELRNLQNGVSDLFLKLKEYLIQKKIIETSFEKEFLWLQILEERELFHHRDLHFKHIVRKEKEATHIWSALNELTLYHYDFFRNNFEKERPQMYLLKDSIHLLDNFYISLQLKYTAELLNRQNLLSIQSQASPLIEPIFSLFKQNNITLSLQNKLYYKLYLFLEKSDLSKFTNLKTFLFDHRNELHKEEKLTALLYLLNFLANELKKGNYELRKETLELYKFGLEGQSILIHKGLIDTVNFRNIVNLACHLGEFSWAENFIKKFQKNLDISIRTENTSIAWAMLYFEKKDYHKVIQNIDKTKFSGIFYIILSRIYTMASNFELNDTDDLDIACETFIRYVRRNKKLGDGSKSAAIQFAKILHHLVLRKLPPNEIKKEISETNSLYFRAWLERKLQNYSLAAV